MDNLIKRFDAVRDSDLMVCERRGVAYQKKMGLGRVVYGQDYFDKVKAYEDTEVAKRVNSGRLALLQRHLQGSATVLDIGAGSGAFLKCCLDSGFMARGFDIIPRTVDLLKAEGHYSKDFGAFEAVCLWDTVEHLENPQEYLDQVACGSKLFVSVPVFDRLVNIRQSKHYRPGEHLYYWTEQGFVDWMRMRGFRLLETSWHEVEAGRESICAFAFAKDLPDYDGYIGIYREMHSTRYYGGSSTELHLTTVADLVRAWQPRSILDYGCGRSDLVSHFWLDGKRRIDRYDPAISSFQRMPRGRFDLVLCCDVMEHVPATGVDRVLGEVRSKSTMALFTISTKPARAKLPDGSNAHITLLTSSEWTRWITDVFGQLTSLPSKWEHELILLAGRK